MATGHLAICLGHRHRAASPPPAPGRARSATGRSAAPAPGRDIGRAGTGHRAGPGHFARFTTISRQRASTPAASSRTGHRRRGRHRRQPSAAPGHVVQRFRPPALPGRSSHRPPAAAITGHRARTVITGHGAPASAWASAGPGIHRRSPLPSYTHAARSRLPFRPGRVNFAWHLFGQFMFGFAVGFFWSFHSIAQLSRVE